MRLRIFFLLLQTLNFNIGFMMKLITSIGLLLCSVSLFSQNNDISKYRLINTSDRLGISRVELLDPYLSPLEYSGIGINYEHTGQKFFSTENTNLSMEGKIKASAAYSTNPQQTAAMMYMGAAYSWGMFYHFRPASRLQLLAGGTADIGIGYKYLPRNVNNPVNVDLATNLNIAGKVRYDIPFHRWPVRLNYEIEIPVLGYMFVPQMGASYYEMFELGSFSNAFHLSSLHNKLASYKKLIFDFPFKHSTFRLGVDMAKLKYKANDMVFTQNSFSLQIGLKYDLYIFSGRKKLSPDNFISSDK